MGTLLLLMGGGFLVSLTVFFICEEKSLKNADFSDMKGLFTEELKVSECLDQFHTIRYLTIYFLVMIVFDLAIANLVFIPKAYGLLEVFAYTFIPSLVGSWMILMVKWTYQPVIKLASSFLYGSVYIGASAIAFSISYWILA